MLIQPRERVPWSTLIVALAILAFVGAICWYAAIAPAPMQLVIPGASDQSFQALRSDAPVMAGWDAVQVNDDNPFVPWRERMGKPKAAPPDPTPPGPVTGHQPGPTPHQERLPIQPPGGGDLPRALGFQHHEGQAGALIIQLPGETGNCLMEPGEIHGRWTFLGIEAGNIARFRDHDGRVYTSLIGGTR